MVVQVGALGSAIYRADLTAGRLINLQNVRATHQSTQVRVIPDQNLRQYATRQLCRPIARWQLCG